MCVCARCLHKRHGTTASGATRRLALPRASPAETDAPSPGSLLRPPCASWSAWSSWPPSPWSAKAKRTGAVTQARYPGHHPLEDHRSDLVNCLKFICLTKCSSHYYQWSLRVVFSKRQYYLQCLFITNAEINFLITSLQLFLLWQENIVFVVRISNI